MTEYDAMYAAVLADPADDTVRLVLADWLDEHPDFTPGASARAELIRTQVDLTRLGPPRKRIGFGTGAEGPADVLSGGPNYWVFTDVFGDAAVGERVDVRMLTNLFNRKRTKVVDRRGLLVTKRTDLGSGGIEYVVKRDKDSKPWEGDRLRKRERAILKEWGVAWLTAGEDRLRPAEWIESVDGNLVEWLVERGAGEALDVIRPSFVRGFVGAVRLTLPAFYRHAATIFRRWPVERVTADGRNPTNASGTYWFADEFLEGSDDPLLAGGTSNAHYLPYEVLANLRGYADTAFAPPYHEYTTNWFRRHYRHYTTAAAARAALSDALVTLGRERARKPVTEPAVSRGEG